MPTVSVRGALTIACIVVLVSILGSRNSVVSAANENIIPNGIHFNGGFYKRQPFSHKSRFINGGDEVVVFSNHVSDMRPTTSTTSDSQKQHNENASDDDGLDHVLIMSIVKDHTSWGRDRNFASYISLIKSFRYPLQNMSLGLLVSDRETFQEMKREVIQMLKHYANSDDPQPFFLRITLIHSIKDLDLSREVRQEQSVQKERRRFLALLRNRLLSVALRFEDAVLWIDVDVAEIDAEALLKMVTSKKDIVVTLTVNEVGRNYDLNTWKGPRTKPNEEERKTIVAGGQSLFWPLPAPGSILLDKMADQGEFVQVDSVGGTVLFVRGEVHRSGVVFPTNNMIGGEWAHEGYDGIETEGLCYMAKFLGYKCWGTPKIKAVHHD